MVSKSKTNAATDTALLNDIQVAKPCPADWNAMSGDDRSRFCSSCRKNVYNLSAMTTEEAAALVREKEGKMCVRFYLRADGTMLTQDCPVGVARFRQRVTRVLAASVVGFAAFAMAATDFMRLGNGQPPLFIERLQVWAQRAAPPQPEPARTMGAISVSRSIVPTEPVGLILMVGDSMIPTTPEVKPKIKETITPQPVEVKGRAVIGKSRPSSYHQDAPSPREIERGRVTMEDATR